MAKNSTVATVGKAVVGVAAIGATFILATSIAGAVNNRSFVQEIQAWGQHQEQEIEDDKTNDEVPEEGTETGDDTNVEVDPVANVIKIG